MQTIYRAAVVVAVLVFVPQVVPADDSASPDTVRSTVVLGDPLPGGERPDQKVEPGRLHLPFGVDFDAQDNMYIAELDGGRVHKLSADGKFSTISGGPAKGYTGDGGPAAKARFNGMHNLAATSGGDIYISDAWNHSVRKIDGKTGIISTIAGTGQPGFSGDGGPATKATFHDVMCVSLNPTNDKLYVADLKNFRIRVVDLVSGIVETVAGNGNSGVPKDGDDARKAPLRDPRAAVVDANNNLYILERGGHALRLVTPDGKIWTVAGTGQRGDSDGPALSASLGSPKHLCLDDVGNVIIADDLNGLIRKYDPKQKTLTSIFGRGMGKPPRYLSHPHGVCLHKGTLYVLDTWHHRILKLE